MQIEANEFFAITPTAVLQMPRGAESRQHRGTTEIERRVRIGRSKNLVSPVFPCSTNVTTFPVHNSAPYLSAAVIPRNFLTG